MNKKTILLAGGSAVGKTAVLKWLVPQLLSITPMICKIDCYAHAEVVSNFQIPYILGISGDVCPDHFLVTNLPDLWNYADAKNCNTVILETAGLCHRCSPATNKMLSGCVIDCTLSTKAPQSLGPMLLYADFLVITKIDMVSQAEREIILWKLQTLNPTAKLFPIDALSGYGTDKLANYILSQECIDSFEGDELRHSMPMGICSYCIGESRVGEAFQQGVTAKINFGGKQ